MAKLVEEALAQETSESLETFLLEHSTESHQELTNPIGHTVAYESWHISFKTSKLDARINRDRESSCDATAAEYSFFRAAA